MDVYVVNESSLSETDAWRIAWACDYQARFHLGRSGWRSDVRVFYLPGGAQATVPAGGSVLHLLEKADVQGALGYHDEDGSEIPYARVFVKTAIAAGDQVQGSSYDVGAPEGRTTGVTVANFALPAYFDANTKREKVDFRGALSTPFSVAPHGYMSYVDLVNVAAGWQQTSGANADHAAPDKDDRQVRRTGAGK